MVWYDEVEHREASRARHHERFDMKTVAQTIRFFANANQMGRFEQEENALEANGFVLTMVPADGPAGGTWPRWVRDGIEYTSAEALATEARLQRMHGYRTDWSKVGA